VPAQGQSLGDAFIELHARLDTFEREMEAATSPLRGLSEAADRAGQQASEALVESARRSRAALDTVGDGAFEGMRASASRAGEQVTNQFQEAGRQSDEALAKVDGNGFTEAKQSASKAAESIDHDFKNATTNAGSHFKGFAIAVGSALAGAGLGLFVEQSVQGANEAASSFSKLTAVVATTGQAAGLTAEQMASIATDLEFKIGVDDEGIQQAEAVMATFKNVTGDTFTQSIGLAADMSAVFGGDLSSSATQLGKALNDPVKGVAALNRIGIQFTADQKDQIAAMIKAGDVAGAQGIIMQEVGGSNRDRGATHQGRVG
jgi:phage-related minor tail protein